MRTALLAFVGLQVAALHAQDLNPTRIRLHRWATGISSPVVVTNAGDDRLFVVEQAGRIRIITDSMEVVTRPYLDIQTRVNSTNNEQGLLGLAFDPDYANNGYFYVNYIFGSGSGSTRISRFQVTADPDSADAASEVVLYTWPQPYTNHNGGCLQFGSDGYLYCGFGDGGSADDPQNHGQTLADPLGDMIRIDVSAHDDTYLVPPTNPHAGATGDTLPEIWASGLRNPWRFSFDRENGDLWIGDVGQGAWEEVDHWPAGDDSGPNFGWRCREGFVATPGMDQTGCLDASGYVAPVRAFSHTPQGWCAITGGNVYRGAAYPHLAGRYIFTDYCAGDFIGLSAPDYAVDTLYQTTSTGYAAMGEDVNGEIYVVNVDANTVDKIYDACPMDDPTLTFEDGTLSATEGQSYQWYMDNVLIPNATEQTYVPLVNGVYYARVNFGAPCTLRTAPVGVLSVGIAEQDRDAFRVYPVPAATQLVVESPEVRQGTWSVELVDATGRTAAGTTWVNGNDRLVWNTANVANGIFLLRVRDAEGRVKVTRRVTIAH